MRKGHVARRRWEEISHLNQVGINSVGRRKNKGKKKKRGLNTEIFWTVFEQSGTEILDYVCYFYVVLLKK